MGKRGVRGGEGRGGRERGGRSGRGREGEEEERGKKKGRGKRGRGEGGGGRKEKGVRDRGGGGGRGERGKEEGEGGPGEERDNRWCCLNDRTEATTNLRTTKSVHESCKLFLKFGSSCLATRGSREIGMVDRWNGRGRWVGMAERERDDTL